MDAVCRTGSVVFKSGLAFKRDKNITAKILITSFDQFSFIRKYNFLEDFCEKLLYKSTQLYDCVVVSDEQGVLLHLLFTSMQCEETLQ